MKLPSLSCRFYNVALTRAETTFAETTDAYSASGVEGIVKMLADSLKEVL